MLVPIHHKIPIQQNKKTTKAKDPTSSNNTFPYLPKCLTQMPISLIVFCSTF